jgi:hypothetical protein
LFNAGGNLSNDYVFIAGAANGYLFVNVESISQFQPGDVYTIVLQGHNTLASFGAGDIINDTF